MLGRDDDWPAVRAGDGRVLLGGKVQTGSQDRFAVERVLGYTRASDGLTFAEFVVGRMRERCPELRREDIGFGSHTERQNLSNEVTVAAEGQCYFEGTRVAGVEWNDGKVVPPVAKASQNNFPRNDWLVEFEAGASA